MKAKVHYLQGKKMNTHSCALTCLEHLRIFILYKLYSGKLAVLSLLMGDILPVKRNFISYFKKICRRKAINSLLLLLWSWNSQSLYNNYLQNMLDAVVWNESWLFTSLQCFISAEHDFHPPPPLTYHIVSTDIIVSLNLAQSCFH